MGGAGGAAHRRRSLRIEATDARPRTRSSRIKRKCDDDGDGDGDAAAAVSKLAKQVWKGRDSPRNGHHSTHRAVFRQSSREENQKPDDDDRIANDKASVMPNKHILELVLDTLQRRDTYEIFAEPVNPDEVEDYYEIIKEPMDFGTMRAKLHEGMYETLDQFEHDVFLIPENAMHFNSSATTYFRQARAIHELAKKVFHALKMDPENFVLEFSGTRRRSMRKALSESSDLKLPTAIKPGDVGSNAFPKGTSTFRRNGKKTSGCTTETSTAQHDFCARNLLAGRRDGRAADRRFTYRAWSSSLSIDKGTSVASTSFRTCNQLLLMNQVDISYRNSLMSFVKDLGPTAQMVARQKLLGQHESTVRMQSEKCHPCPAATQGEESGCLETPAHRTIRDLHPSCRRFFPVDNIIDLTRDGEEASADHPEKQKSDIALRTRKASKTTNIAKKDRVVVRKNHRSNKTGRGLKNAGKSDDNVKMVILALENSHSKGGAAECKLRNKKSSTTLPWSVSQRCGLPGDSMVHEEEAKKPLPAAGPFVPLTSQFTFDLPFLKARLDQMNSLEIGGQRMRRPSFDRGGGGGSGGRGVGRVALNGKQPLQGIISP